jgi:hypothetical protein
MTALSASPDKALPPRPPKVRFRAAAALFEPAILRRAAAASARKLDPRGLIYFPMLILGPIGERITGLAHR